MSDRLQYIIQRIASGEYSEADITALQQGLQAEDGRSLLQLGKYNISIGEGKDIQIGDRTFVEINDAAVQAIVEALQSGAAPKTPAQVDFQPYLRSLVDTYKEWWRYYTLTDATGKIQEAESESPSPFDFGLMVQTVPKENDSVASEANPLQDKQEKIERLPVLEGIRKYTDDHVLLVGRPGSGKSTALIRLLLETATKALEQGSGQVPILVELRYWQTSVNDRIQAFLHKHDPTLSLDDSTLTSLLRQGRFLLLIDGLNELPSEMARTHLASFRQDYSKVPMIFTTRDLGLGGDLGIEKKLEMQPLTEGQMQEFIRAYVPDQAEAMLRQLSDRLQEFGQTPLLLWMLCEVFQQSSEHQMPSNLAGIFQAFTRMYEDSSVRKHGVALLRGDVRPLSDRRLWKPALKAIASVMMQGETLVDFRVAIHRDEAERELSRIFSNEKFPVRDILDDLLKYHLLQNRSADQIEFRHQLIQEYYAAEYLLRFLPELSDEQLKRDYLNLLKWTEPIALMLALVDEEKQALRMVKLAIDDVDLMLGARLAGEVKERLQQKIIRWIDQLEISHTLKVVLLSKTQSKAAVKALFQSLESVDPNVHRSSIRALSSIGTEHAIQALLTALEHPNYNVHWMAAEALGSIGKEYAIRALESSDSSIRWVVTEELGKIDKEDAIPGLLVAFKDKDSDVRRIAVKALGEMHCESAIEGLLLALEDENSSIRLNAAKALGSIGNEQVVPALVRILEDEEYSVRQTGAEALGKFFSKQAATSLQTLILKDRNYGVRRIAAEALVRIDEERAIQVLLEALKYSDCSVCQSVIEALGKVGSKKAIPVLTKALRSRRSGVYQNAAEALRKISSDQAVPVLLKALKHNDSEIRRSAAKILGDIGNEQAVPELLKALSSRNSAIRQSTVEALGKIGSEQAIPGLLKALSSQNSAIRQSTVEALGKIGSEQAIPGLLVALKDKVPFIRRSTAQALGKIGGDSAVSGLLKALEDQDFVVRQISAKALGKVGKENVVSKLLNALEDENSSVRDNAANALGEIGGDKVVQGLIKLLVHQRPFVRLNAAKALGRIGGKQATQELLTSMRDEDPSVRFIVAEFFGRSGGKHAARELLIALGDKDSSVRWIAAKSLANTGGPDILSELWRVGSLPQLMAIQNRCKFYNYEITQNNSPDTFLGKR